MVNTTPAPDVWCVCCATSIPVAADPSLLGSAWHGSCPACGVHIQVFVNPAPPSRGKEAIIALLTDSPVGHGARGSSLTLDAEDLEPLAQAIMDAIQPPVAGA